jgi:hypothetical protein
VHKIIVFLTCVVAAVCPRYKNYSRTALMCNDPETLLVLLFECIFRSLVKDRVGVDMFLYFLMYCLVVIVVAALYCIVFPLADG